MDTRMLKLPEVMEKTALSKTSIYELARIGAFPLPIKLTGRAVGWSHEEVSAWLEKRANQRVHVK